MHTVLLVHVKQFTKAVLQAIQKYPLVVSAKYPVFPQESTGKMHLSLAIDVLNSVPRLAVQDETQFLSSTDKYEESSFLQLVTHSSLRALFTNDASQH